jgi:hypothetical protein
MNDSPNAAQYKYDDDDKVLQALRAPFAEKDLAFVTFKTGDDWAIVAPYVDARAVRRRLNGVLGPPNWENVLKPVGHGDGFVCSLMFDLPSGARVRGEDAAQMTDIESVKGGASQSLRRTAAAVAGIGEYLYAIEDDIFVDYDEDNYPPFSKNEAVGELPTWAKLMPLDSQEALVDTGEGMGLSEQDINTILREADHIPANAIDEVPMAYKKDLWDAMQLVAESDEEVAA